MPRQLLRLGLSQSASSLFLADGVENLSVLAILAIGEGFFKVSPWFLKVCLHTKQ
jgi:hypothetical protein